MHKYESKIFDHNLQLIIILTVSTRFLSLWGFSSKPIFWCSDSINYSYQTKKIDSVCEEWKNNHHERWHFSIVVTWRLKSHDNGLKNILSKCIFQKVRNQNKNFLHCEVFKVDEKKDADRCKQLIAYDPKMIRGTNHDHFYET